GDTTFAISAFHNRIGRYIYGRTLDVVDGLQLLQYSQQDAVFTGLEGQVRQRLNRHWGVDWSVGLFGDVVRARLADGSALPRIAPARLGVRLDGEWGAWQGQVEWLQVSSQRRVAALETATPGYGMLNAQLAWRGQWQGTPWQVYLKGQNLTNRLAYAHTSYIKTDAPLRGRNLVAGVRVDF
ncbi:MAG: TonB-dependent receptor, partial [Burkholderiaceae bacterium]